MNSTTQHNKSPRRANPQPAAPPAIEPMEPRLLMSATLVAQRQPTTPAADDRPTEEVAFYYNKIAFNY
jgi:hypothetical protein